MAASLPDARVHLLDGTAHCPMLDRPHDLSSVVLSFLDTVVIARQLRRPVR